MRIQPLHDLQQEINRLFIAGSRFAKDDPRLLRVAASLDPLGEKAPVFKRLAAEARALAAADAMESADRLGALGAMLHSVLHTQGDALEEGREKGPQIPTLDLADVSTPRSHAELVQVRELNLAKSGRLELAREAFRQGMFADFRCFPALDAMLGERYAELADFVADTVMPAAGKGVVPFACRNFRYEDTAEQARRFRVIAHFDPPQLSGMIDAIFGESLPGLQAEAVAVLARSPDNEEMIVKLVDDRNRKVREAACMGLAKLATPRALETLLGLFLGGKTAAKREAAAAALAEARVAAGGEAICDALAERVEQSFEALASRPVPIGRVEEAVKKATGALKRLAGLGRKNVPDPEPSADAPDPAEAIKKTSELAEAFLGDLRTLRGKDSERVRALLDRMVSDERLAALSKFYGRPDGELEHLFDRQIPEALSEVVNSVDGPRAESFYERWLPRLPGGALGRLWGAYFGLAVRTWPRERVYERFADPLDEGRLLVEDLFHAYFHALRPEAAPSGRECAVEMVDPRWLPHLYRRADADGPDEDILRLLHACEPPDSERFAAFLAGLGSGGKNRFFEATRLRMLVEREHPRRYELVYDAIAKSKERIFSYQLMDLPSFWGRCPKEYAEKFRALAATSGKQWLAALIKTEGEE